MSQRIQDGRAHPAADDRLNSKTRADAEHGRREADCATQIRKDYDEVLRNAQIHQDRLRNGGK
jgi:hypothetical protein